MRSLGISCAQIVYKLRVSRLRTKMLSTPAITFHDTHVRNHRLVHILPG